MRYPRDLRYIYAGFADSLALVKYSGPMGLSGLWGPPRFDRASGQANWARDKALPEQTQCARNRFPGGLRGIARHCDFLRWNPASRQKFDSKRPRKRPGVAPGLPVLGFGARGNGALQGHANFVNETELGAAPPQRASVLMALPLKKYYRSAQFLSQEQKNADTRVMPVQI